MLVRRVLCVIVPAVLLLVALTVIADPAPVPESNPASNPASQRRPRPMTEPQGARQGPRPLPLHLMVAALTWTSSRAALPLLNSASPPWRPEVQSAAAALQASLEKVDPEAFQGAVERGGHIIHINWLAPHHRLG